MNEEQMHARHLAELGFLQDVLNELDYTSQLIEKSNETPYHTLVVKLEPVQGRHGASQLALNFYPLADEEFTDTLFLQYFIALPLRPTDATRGNVLELMVDINNRLVVGHVGLSSGESQAHFRYVQPLPSDELVTTEKIANVLLLVTYSPQLFQDALREVADGSMTPGAAKQKLAEAFGPV